MRPSTLHSKSSKQVTWHCLGPTQFGLPQFKFKFKFKFLLGHQISHHVIVNALIGECPECCDTLPSVQDKTVMMLCFYGARRNDEGNR